MMIAPSLLIGVLIVVASSVLLAVSAVDLVRAGRRVSRLEHRASSLRARIREILPS
jgi:hypothetical protein